jgi:secreted PhoX family phosphatase
MQALSHSCQEFKAMSAKDLDVGCNTSSNRHFQSVLQAGLSSPSRRAILKGGLGLAALSSVYQQANASTSNASSALGFASVPKSLIDDVVLPPGYRYAVLHATGDALVSGLSAYSNQGSESDDWSRRIGDHHDGMDLFFIDAGGRLSDVDTGRALLVVNHESSADSHFMHPNGQTSSGVSGKKFTQFGDWDLGRRPELEVLKEINQHGVSIVELNRYPDGWRVNWSSSLNRRVTAQTPMRVAGPAAHLSAIQTLMQTRWSPDGQKVRGTLNNCGHGKTPWGTYLACEENWAFYFQVSAGGAQPDSRELIARKRYGLPLAAPSATAARATSQGWHTVSDTDDRFARWNLAYRGAGATQDFRNEANTFGYNVEIDPIDGVSIPVKRTAMGRFAHEAAVCSPPKTGEPLAFYMGCDARNEYIYKFVTQATWDPADAGLGLAAGDKYLDEGRLFVARFDADGTGEWLELTMRDPRIASYQGFRFESEADMFVHTRHAADAVRATPMDRPEWAAVNPRNGEVYFTLTNNSAANRSPEKTNAANPRAYQDQDGKKGAGNPNGHIIRFREAGGLSTATRFQWDVFLFGAEEDSADANLSGLTAGNSFSSPDGLWFSPATGICWIQTDDGAMTDESNCMMLAAIPGSVGDGGRRTVSNRMTVGGSEQSGTQETFIGAVLGEARLRRFLVAPPGAEVTGVTETPDGKVMFVNIQHPGENTRPGGKLESLWPGNLGYGKMGRPRSATIMITRDDGGVIGL